MKTAPLPQHVQMLFALLRASLNETEPEISFFQDITENVWKKCYHLAAKQGVMALAWDGVAKLPKDIQPPLAIKITWATGVERYEQKYNRYCETIVQLSEFYKQHGISTMQIKGVGLSTLYPIPSHREGGDIDIYTYSAAPDKLTDNEANSLADTLIQEQGIEVDTSYPKHSHFYYNNIPIENHKTFVNVKDYKEAPLVNETLIKQMNPQKTELPAGDILTPSPAFNTLFIALHAFQHYGSGLALHHLCDWAVILKNYGLNIPDTITGTKLLKGFAALTFLCNKYLGTNIQITGDDDISQSMLDEILSPKYSENNPPNNKIGVLIYKTKRLLYNHKIKNSILTMSLSKRIFSSVVAHIRNPKSIFN
jgi:hypothetical protein